MKINGNSDSTNANVRHQPGAVTVDPVKEPADIILVGKNDD